MQRAIIVEDEPRSRELLRSLVSTHCPDIEVVAVAGNVAEAVALIKQHKPGLLFLDIELQTGTGFDVLREIDGLEPSVIFTTAYDHYAIKAIKFSAVDYLLKPIDIEELKEAVSKTLNGNRGAQQQIIAVLKQNLQLLNSSQNPTLTLSLAGEFEFIPLKDIIRIEAAGAYSHFFLKDRRNIIVSKNLKEYELLLTGHSFMRVHNSHIINLNEIKRMLKTDGGYAVMSDGTEVIISPKRKDEFVQLMNNRNL